MTFCFASSYAHSQDTSNVRRWSLTWKPLGVVDPVSANLTFGVGYQINPVLSVNVDLGLMRSWNRLMILDEVSAIARTGFKTSGEIKYHYQVTYVALQGFYNNFDRSNREYVWRYGRAYRQSVVMHRDTRVYGLHVMAGAKYESKSKRIYLETYAGYGIRYKESATSGLPEDGEPIPSESRSSPFIGPEDEVTPSIALGVRIGYRL